MIRSTNLASQVIQPNQSVPFASNVITTGCSARHEQGSNRFTLLKCGIYMITFNTSFSTTAAGTAILAIQANGETIPAAEVNVTTAANSLYTNTIAVPVRVYNDCCVDISVKNLSTVPVTMFDTGITIERLCG